MLISIATRPSTASVSVRRRCSADVSKASRSYPLSATACRVALRSIAVVRFSLQFPFSILATCLDPQPRTKDDDVEEYEEDDDDENETLNRYHPTLPEPGC
jgi:hypothetical protein